MIISFLLFISNFKIFSIILAHQMFIKNINDYDHLHYKAIYEVAVRAEMQDFSKMYP